MKRLICISVSLLVLTHGFSQSYRNDSTLASAVRDTRDTLHYATLYFYRAFIPKMYAPLKKVPIYINDSLVYKLKANMIFALKVFKEGKIRIAIDPGGGDEIITKVKLGNEYFYRCSIERGLWFGKPAIETVTQKTGKEESGNLTSE